MRRLGLHGAVHGDFDLPVGINLALETLYLAKSAHRPAQYLTKVIDNAPRLARLELRDFYGGFPSEVLAALLVLAPQLRRVSLVPPPYSSQGKLTALDASTLLRASASMVALDLVWMDADDLPALLSSVLCHLELLMVSFDPVHSAGFCANDIAEALRQPALSNLKRWTWMDRIEWLDGDIVSCSEETVDG